MVVYFEHPSFEVTIDEDVKAEDLEAVALPLLPSSIELILLFNQRKGLHSEDALLAHFANLLEKKLCVYFLLHSELL